MSNDQPLTGKRILMFVADIYEDLELWYPKLRLQEAGADVVVAGPKEGQTYNATSLSVDFLASNFVISLTGGHIHYQLDTRGEVMWFSLSSFTLTNLTDGKHLLKVYLADANHTRMANPEASVQVTFTLPVRNFTSGVTRAESQGVMSFLMLM